MSLEKMQSRHMAHDIIIKALLENLSAEQIANVAESVQNSFDAFTNGSAGSAPSIASGLDNAKQYASGLLGKEIK